MYHLFVWCHKFLAFVFLLFDVQRVNSF